MRHLGQSGVRMRLRFCLLCKSSCELRILRHIKIEMGGERTKLATTKSLLNRVASYLVPRQVPDRCVL